HVSLTFENTALRWLGLYIQFLDANDNPVIAPNFDYPSASPTTAFLGIIPPEFTILGIPVQSSNATAAFDFPTGVASSPKVLASGLGGGSHTFPDTEGLGIFMTTVFNLICPPSMIAAGAAQNLDPFIKLGIIPLVQTSIEEFFTLLDDLNGDVGYQ